MPPHIFSGPFQPGLENAFVAYLEKNPPTPHRRVGVVTASRQMSLRLQRLLALETPRAWFNLDFLTFHGLAMTVFGAVGQPAPSLINDDLFYERLMETLLIEENLFPADRAPALAGSHWATVRDLLDADTRADLFEEHFGDLEMEDGESLQRVLRLTDRFRERLNGLGVVTSSELSRRAAELLRQRPEAALPFDELVYYGFYDLNAAQTEFYRALAERSAVTVFFPCVGGRPAWAFAERFQEQQLRGGGAVVRALEKEIQGPLGTAALALFDPDTAQAPARPDQITRFNASGERDELWRVAKEILRWRESHPTAPWDAVGVVARGLEPYLPFLADVFDAHAIPYSLEDRGPLLRDPVARALATLARLPAFPHSAEALDSLLAVSTWFRTGLRPDEQEEARAYVKLHGPRLGWRGVLESLSALPPAVSSLRRPNPPRALRDFTASIAGFDADGARPWSEWCQRVQRHWRGLLSGEAQSTEGFERVGEVLSRLAEFDRFSGPATYERFLEMLLTGLERARRGPGPNNRGVRVRSAMDARGDSFDLLFLMGCKEGLFPRVIREDPLLSDDARRLLRDPGGHWILPKIEGYEEEKLLFTLLVTAARERLVLSYSRARDDGRAEIPSLYLRELARATRSENPPTERLPRAPREKWSSVPGDTLTPAEARALDILAGRRADVPFDVGKFQSAEIPNDWDGRGVSWPGLSARWTEKGFSPSGAESLVTCPFRFLMSRGLGVSDDEPIYNGEAFSRRWLGQVRHRVLHEVYASFAGPELPLPGDAADRAGDALRRLWALLNDPVGGAYPLVWSTQRDLLEKSLRDFVARDVERLRAEGFRPDHLEWDLGPHLLGGILWAGRVDRVDTDPAGRRVRLVDYKNKTASKSLVKRLADGEAFQASVYLDLLAAAYPGWTVCGARFEALAENVTEELSEEDWVQGKETWRDIWRRPWAALQSGAFPIRPGDTPQSPCRACAFARACRKAHGPSRRRAERLYAEVYGEAKE